MNFEHHLPLSAAIVDREGYLLSKCRGKRVLHLGCVDSGLMDSKLWQKSLLHYKLTNVAGFLVGVDSDVDGIRRLQTLGVGDVNMAWNVEEIDRLPYDSPLDVILAGEIIEHTSSPGLFLQSMRGLIERTGAEMILTTPNAFGFTYLWRILCREELVHPDHNFYFSYTTLSTLLKKCGYQVIEFYWYSNPSTRAWAWLRSQAARFSVRRSGALAENASAAPDFTEIAPVAPGLPRLGLADRLQRAVAWLAYLFIKDALLRFNPALAHGLIFTCRSGGAMS